MAEQDDQESYDSLVNDSEFDEVMMGLDPGTSIIFSDGTAVHRNETGWNWGGDPVDTPPDGPYDPADLERVSDYNGHRQTAEQEFRKLLGGK